ncbi:flagellar filament capping protein FliD [Novosphingobium guangzhouense]|uniref:Flagellar hook-associated protein 2 n=1 Tax=Novosphingobium guangzhouense TaxID=1850347 RepID=A0A2K2FZH9_9SPHN|nr:flagellar filament capping protein FliD [Novosphingobium guangzhouense]PNU04195.1 flagellar hook protein [Novosphingobium guangzhouense]
MTTTTSSTSSATTTTSLVTALGGGSGVDMTALANNLANAQFASRNDRLTAKSDKLDAQISAASNIKSLMLGLDTSLGTLVRSGSLARTPSVANAAVAGATLSGASQPGGSYSLEVTRLASGQQLASTPYASTTSAVGSGTLSLKFGTVSGGSFAQDTSRTAVDITIPAGATLADVAGLINGADAGVSAYVTTTVDGAQLVLKGAEGAANGFVLEAGDPSLAALAWAPGSSNGQLMSTAGDAAFKVDGLSMTAKSNTVTDAIPGVKLQLAATNTGAPTTVSFSDPTSAIATSMQDFVDALNEVVSALNSATSLGADLANDPGARALKRSLSSLGGTTIMPNATGPAKTLADLGLKIQRDGTFTLDTSRLSATQSADPKGVAAMFTNGVHGVFATVDKIYRSATSTSDAYSLGSSIAGYTKKKTSLATEKTDLAEQQEKLRARLVSQYTASETRIGTSKSTLAMLTNQIAQWNKSS